MNRKGKLLGPRGLNPIVRRLKLDGFNYLGSILESRDGLPHGAKYQFQHLAARLKACPDTIRLFHLIGFPASRR